jgi:hypothetical protein
MKGWPETLTTIYQTPLTKPDFIDGPEGEEQNSFQLRVSQSKD